MKKIISIFCALAAALCMCSCAEPLNAASANGNIITPEASENLVTARYSDDAASIELSVPEDWSFEDYSGDGCCGLILSPKSAPELCYSLLYYERGFGVCGTGLEEERTQLGKDGIEANIGYYDGGERWSFIAFRLDGFSYALTWSCAGGAEPDDSVVSACHDEIYAMLDSLKLGK